MAGFIESWGRGIEKICSACKVDGVFVPEYTVNPSDIMIHFTAPEERIVRMNSLERSKELGVGTVNGTEVGTENGTENGTEVKSSTELEDDILSLIKENPSATYDEIAQAMEISRRSLSRKMQALKACGVITRVGSDTKGYWKINV